MRAVLTARLLEGCPATLQTGDVAVILDGRQEGIQTERLERENAEESQKSSKQEDDEEEQDAEAEPAKEEDKDDPRPDFCAEILQIAYTKKSLNARHKRIAAHAP